MVEYFLVPGSVVLEDEKISRESEWACVVKGTPQVSLSNNVKKNFSGYACPNLVPLSKYDTRQMEKTKWHVNSGWRSHPWGGGVVSKDQHFLVEEWKSARIHPFVITTVKVFYAFC